jgi:hypothetical protein
MNKSIKILLLCVIGVQMVSGSATAQESVDSELFKVLKAQDSILFQIGFNKCKVEQSAALMYDDLEFYHDKSGVSHSKAEFVEIMRNGICRENNPRPTYRFLVEKSLEVFPLYNNGQLYGALQNGKHFFSTEKEKTFKESDNYALFSHLWIIENGQWKLKRVISYNHNTKAINTK